MKNMFVSAAVLAAVVAGPAWAALTVGAAAPDFTLTAYQDGNPSQFALKSALSKGPVVLYFFPGAFTPGCNIEAQAFAEKIDEFKAAGANVVGVTGSQGTSARASGAVSATLQEAVRDFSKEHCNGKFPVIAADGGIIENYQAASTQRPGSSSRTSFVIGKDGKIALAYTSNDAASHIAETLKAVQALR